MTTAITFSRQNDAGSRARTAWCEKISLSSLDLKVSYKLFKPTGEQINRVSIIYPIVVINSVCCRRNLTPVSSVCEAAPLSLFCTGHGLNELPEMHCEFPFNLIGKSTMDFLTGQSWRALKSCWDWTGI